MTTKNPKAENPDPSSDQETEKSLSLGDYKGGSPASLYYDEGGEKLLTADDKDGRALVEERFRKDSKGQSNQPGNPLDTNPKAEKQETKS